jgi:integrase/recombinase XerD
LDTEVDYLFLNSWGTPLTKNGVQQMVRRWGRRAGLTHVRRPPHTFRHTFAKNYLVNGGDVFTLQRILGHTTLTCVRIYVNMFAADVKRQHGLCSPADNLAATSGQASRWLGPAGGPKMTRDRS